MYKHRIRFTLFALLTMAALCATYAPQAHARVYGSYQAEYQRYLDESLMPHLGTFKVVKKSPAWCRGTLGCTWPGGPVYVNHNQPAFQRRLTLLHEQAHQIDYRYFDSASRSAIKRAMGWGFAKWRGLDNAQEQYAEIYAWCAVGLTPDSTAAYDIDRWHTEIEFWSTCDTIKDEMFYLVQPKAPQD